MSKLEPCIQMRAEEYLIRCCEKRKTFYYLFATLYNEALHIDPNLAEAILEAEELVVESMCDIQEAFSEGYRVKEESITR
ncbi:hypothetical protein [Paenibacillus apiarius]|uniref:hypothetical protein n=1 Tax=Paenibacillus apiarius TaxID=46240 RepID=UPI003B3B1693